jgi:GTPase
MDLFCQEPDYGNIEYKSQISINNRYKFEKYSSQMKYRIIEGKGEAIYLIGISDSGKVLGVSKGEIAHIITCINLIAININSKVTLILYCHFNDKFFIIVKIKALFEIKDLPFII